MFSYCDGQAKQFVKVLVLYWILGDTDVLHVIDDMSWCERYVWYWTCVTLPSTVVSTCTYRDEKLEIFLGETRELWAHF